MKNALIVAQPGDADRSRAAQDSKPISVVVQPGGDARAGLDGAGAGTSPFVGRGSTAPVPTGVGDSARCCG
jgi:hypothetical protein